MYNRLMILVQNLDILTVGFLTTEGRHTCSATYSSHVVYRVGFTLS